MLFISKIQKIGVWSSIVLAVLVTLSLPFEYQLLHINFLKHLLAYCSVTVAVYIFPNSSPYTSGFYSDSTSLYVGIGLVCCFSIVTALILVYAEKKKIFTVSLSRLWSFLVTYSSYYLSLQMLIYGCSKAFKFQFYDAHPNTLFTPVGFLTKDFLFWTAMGSSYLYNVVTGSIEIAVGLLLWFRKTRFFAGCIGFILISHIVLLNFSFDINVKVQSLFLMLLFLVIALPNVRRCYLFFFRHKVVKLKQVDFKWITKKYRYIGIKSILLLAILLEALYPYISTGNFNGDIMIRPPLYGAYKIHEHPHYKRFFIHSDPYFIIQDQNDDLYSFPMQLGTETLTITQEGHNNTLQYRIQDSILTLQGFFRGHPLDIEATKIDITKMPLYEDDFKWTIEAYNTKE